MRRKVFTIIIHITCWSLFILLLCKLFPAYSLIQSDEGETGFLITHTYYYWVLGGSCMFFFYFHSQLLFPKLFLRKKYLAYFISLILLMVFVPAMQYLIDTLLIQYLTLPSDSKVSVKGFFIESIGLNTSSLTYVNCFAFTLGYSFYDSWVKDQQLKKLILQDKIKAENQLLRAQINPHFLFNTLNTFFSLAQKHKAPVIEDGVATLSEMFRYTLENKDTTLMPLTKEIEYVKSYVHLQGLRFKDGDDVDIQFKIEGDFEGKEIHQMILINFIENAFKHGINISGRSYIHIDIDVAEKFQMKVRNSVGSKARDDISFGVGLDNTKNRLDLLYPNKHQLYIESTDNYYEVILTLELP
ncbi:sensor histidine kinase [Fulvivirga lutea]|uniref:Sensor histidine kinase n=1 Tax=Fulvivirga lutea TaxID=2810512 RepID=A0A975A201_9BACT|nr:sensor histidine kinase [Fulvivirga lutea]QSE98770.1 sensor histidine kinase [Fulvivirga lutea]